MDTSDNKILNNNKIEKYIKIQHKYATENFYNHKDIKKFMPKINDEAIKFTGIPSYNNHILSIGATGSGKSSILTNYLKLTMSKCKSPTYKSVHMYVKKQETMNFFIKEKLGDYITFYNSMNDFPNVSDFSDLSDKNKNLHLIIFDDFITDNKKDLNKIAQYLIYSRTKGCCCYLLSQSYYQTPIIIRKNIQFLLLAGINSKRDLSSILKENSLSNINYNTLLDMYKFSKIPISDEPTFLKINTSICPINQKFSKYWLLYLNPNDF